MKRGVSPLFAVIVIVVALVIGALWFAVRYRTSEATEAASNRALRQHVERAQSLGRIGVDGKKRQGGGVQAPVRGATGGTGEEGSAPSGEPAGD